MNFKVGDKVRNILNPHFGIGIVTSVTSTRGRPITVVWEDDGQPLTYNEDGTQSKSDTESRLRVLTKLEQILK
jgi:hypothetical protein